MIKGKNFIFTSLQPWDIAIGSNARDIALEVSKNNQVLYINTPLDKKTFKSQNNDPDLVQRKKVVEKELPVLRQLNPNLWVLDYPFTIWPINFLPDGWMFDTINKRNNVKMYSFVKEIISKLGFNEYILFIDNDIYRSFYAKELLNPDLTIYYRRDNLTSPFWQKHAPRLEPLICKKSDCVLTNSEQLANAVKAYNSNTFNIGQGVNLNDYNLALNYEKPEDLKNIPHPIIGYTGMITSKRLDMELIYKTASNLSEYSFVFVGNEDEAFTKHRLHSLKNVYFLGSKASSIIPNYIYYFDICINPQIINPITIGNYPRKIDEYLALGKPVVATKTETMSIFENFTWNCIGDKEYIEAIKQIIFNNNKCSEQEAIDFAHSHSWENSVLAMYNYISKHQ